MIDWTRRGAAVAALGLGLTGSPLAAQEPAPPFIDADRFRRGRMLVPVRIDGRGPFAFAVDSAANASVIASDLADTLALPPAGEVAMHTLIAREVVGTVRTGRVQTGALDARDVRLALASRIGLDGVDGLIGTDLLAGLRLDLHFQGVRRTRVTASRRSGDRFFDARRPSARLVHAVERRFGELLMIEAQAGGSPAVAILDTGAQVSIGNQALARAARTSPIVLRDGSAVSRVQSPTGRSADAQPMMLSGLRFGGLSMGRLPLLIGDFHTFDLWGLADRPAMLMGIDVLGLFESVAIDLKRGDVVFEV
jgi:hypothetical protein